ncbi:hypothetical protein SAPIO_CDS7913 [Scedosporium apiospermum]|uniref:Major facilitator superfamily (MFS) profile domain-containing protein n=1 Tax=Pseudallescheria apiosperma TaxID=563466 RepID=A0A084G0Q0_PSEDA|nr:uncharacterized protein SAPIO_CDS7913 [Scedosporium apiospermum]KEZ40912.1 hypothetical protein SAPIO_CDS7913 [Scedosporium apiospermum]
MFGMSCYAIVTATIAVTSKTREQIMAARVLNYLYVGVELAVIPIYQSEIVPAQARGFIVGSYQFSLMLGGFVINSICLRTSTLPDDRAWRIPVGLFYIIPSIIIALIFFVPESPRWLLRMNRIEDARKSLQRIRAGVFTDEEIDAEFQDLRRGLEKEVEKGKFIELFQGLNLKRTAIVVGVNFFQQVTGQAFSSQYGSIYVKSLGTVNPFKFSLITSGVATPVPVERKTAIVAVMALFVFGFGAGWGPLPYVLATEIPALRLRDHTSRIGFGVNVLMNFAVNFSIPYLVFSDYAGLDSKVGFIFGSFCFLALLFTFFFVPECKGKTLEEVDALFHNGVALRNFGRAGALEHQHNRGIKQAKESIEVVEERENVVQNKETV